ncbi:MAG: FixH family protein [Thalassococcus sp.]|jgi:nitrogen fixation protein FixH|uniref:FixH family protein n=1 Tax=Thalassococcus sp. TaxID=1928858 RepID=UPI001B27B786|nr:FixH family protein [Thalassococcus sp.]MBO6867034.1 FixH family protein [Thalassococcus sp.]
MTARKITGYHVFAVFALAFSIIIGVNVTMAVNAVRTFPGIESKNSYIDSQTFNERRAAQEALNWDLDVALAAREIEVRFDDGHGPIQPQNLKAVLGRATEREDDLALNLIYVGGSHVAPIPELGAGRWVLRLEAEAEDGTAFRKDVKLWVTE